MRLSRAVAHALSFDYINDLHRDDNNKEIKVPRPRVEIRLSKGGTSLKLAMLVDSGADVTLLPLEVAEILELEMSEPFKSRSASGKFETKKSKVKAELLKGNKVYDLGEMPVRIPVERVQSDNLNSFALLGRSHFFRRFDVTFRECTLRLILRTPKKK